MAEPFRVPPPEAVVYQVLIRRMEKQSRQVAAMNIAAAVTALIAAGLALLSAI